MDTKRERMELLQQNWVEIKRKVIIPLWNSRFKSMYESSKMDYDDFESLAAIEITKAITDFDSNKSNLFTYATNVLQKKAKTELTFYHREKRVGNIESESINKFEDDEKSPYKNILAIEQKKELHYLAQRYINSLTKVQQKIAQLIIDGYDVESIKKRLKLSDDRFKMIIQRMRSEDKVESLNKLRGARK